MDHLSIDLLSLILVSLPVSLQQGSGNNGTMVTPEILLTESNSLENNTAAYQHLTTRSTRGRPNSLRSAIKNLMSPSTTSICFDIAPWSSEPSQERKLTSMKSFSHLHPQGRFSDNSLPSEVSGWMVLRLLASYQQPQSMAIVGTHGTVMPGPFISLHHLPL